MQPLFNGTLYVVQMTFQVNGTNVADSSADVATAISYLTRAVLPISSLAGQFGPNSLTVSQTPLGFTVARTTPTFTEDELHQWVQTIATDNRLSASDCVVVLNPLGMDIVGRYSRTMGVGGFHDSTNNQPFILVHVAGTPFTVADVPWNYAGNLSHEVAEMCVNPLGGNPEVCDACGPNFNSTYIVYFGANGAYIETSQVPPYNVPFTYDFYINAIAKPAYAVQAQAPAAGCAYTPPGYVGGQMSFGVKLDASGWQSDDCGHGFHLQGDAVNVTAAVQNLIAPNPVLGTTFAWDPPANAKVQGPTNTSSLSLLLDTDGIVLVTVTVTVTDTIYALAQKVTLLISVLTPGEGNFRRAICRLKNLDRELPRPVPIGDPAKRVILPYTRPELVALQGAVERVQEQATALRGELSQLLSAKGVAGGQYHNAQSLAADAAR